MPQTNPFRPLTQHFLPTLLLLLQTFLSRAFKPTQRSNQRPAHRRTRRNQPFLRRRNQQPVAPSTAYQSSAFADFGSAHVDIHPKDDITQPSTRIYPHAKGDAAQHSHSSAITTDQILAAVRLTSENSSADFSEILSLMFGLVQNPRPEEVSEISEDIFRSVEPSPGGIPNFQMAEFVARGGEYLDELEAIANPVPPRLVLPPKMLFGPRKVWHMCNYQRWMREYLRIKGAWNGQQPKPERLVVLQERLNIIPIASA